MLQDVRFAIRSAFRKPALPLVIVISLALGIGANTTIFTVINAVFLRPLPVRDPARLVQIFTVMPKSTAYQSVSLANYRDFRDNVSELSGLAAYHGIGANLVGGTEPLATGGQLVSGNYFQVPDEDTTLGASPVVVISANGAASGSSTAGTIRSPGQARSSPRSGRSPSCCPAARRSWRTGSAAGTRGPASWRWPSGCRPCCSSRSASSAS